MARLNVRCCCQPTKVFGTLEVPDDAVRRGSYAVAVWERAVANPFDDQDTFVNKREEIKREEIKIKPIYFGGLSGGQELAVYSDDRPIEFWRQMPGFIEAAA